MRLAVLAASLLFASASGVHAHAADASSAVQSFAGGHVPVVRMAMAQLAAAQSSDGSGSTVSSTLAAWNQSLQVLRDSVKGKAALEAKVEAFAVTMASAIRSDTSEDKLAEMVDEFMKTLESDPSYAGLVTGIDAQVAETEKVIKANKNVTTSDGVSSSASTGLDVSATTPQPRTSGSSNLSAGGLDLSQVAAMAGVSLVVFSSTTL